MESELLQLFEQLMIAIPLLTGFFAGILINGRRWFWRGLLAGAIGAVILCFIAVQITYIMGYVLVIWTPPRWERWELTAFQTFMRYIYSSIFWGAIAGIVGAGIASWLRNRRKKRPPIPLPSPPARPPQPMRANLIEPRPCPSCGNVNRLGDRFCRRCGTPLPTVPVEEKAYCTKCGTELKKGAKFCHTCGQAVTRITPPREEIPVVEAVLGGIEVTKDYYDGLYLTPNKVIVAKTGGVRWYWLLLLLILTFPLGLLLAPIIAVIVRHKAKKKFKELSELSPVGILRGDKNNFEIPYPDITRVEMKKRAALLRNKITILTGREKHEFYILRKKEFENYVNLIRSVLPNKTYVS